MQSLYVTNLKNRVDRPMKLPACISGSVWTTLAPRVNHNKMRPVERSYAASSGDDQQPPMHGVDLNQPGYVSLRPWLGDVDAAPLALECLERLLQWTATFCACHAYGLLESRSSPGRESPAWAAGLNLKLRAPNQRCNKPSSSE